jgi:hypothetical protein
MRIHSCIQSIDPRGLRIKAISQVHSQAVDPSVQASLGPTYLTTQITSHILDPGCQPPVRRDKNPHAGTEQGEQRPGHHFHHGDATTPHRHVSDQWARHHSDECGYLDSEYEPILLESARIGPEQTPPQPAQVHGREGVHEGVFPEAGSGKPQDEPNTGQ